MKEIKELINHEEKVEVKITWRFFFLVFFLTVTMYFNFVGILNYYEDKMFIGLVFLMNIVSYLLSFFLIRRKEE